MTFNYYDICCCVRDILPRLIWFTEIRSGQTSYTNKDEHKHNTLLTKQTSMRLPILGFEPGTYRLGFRRAIHYARQAALGDFKSVTILTAFSTPNLFLVFFLLQSIIVKSNSYLKHKNILNNKSNQFICFISIVHFE